MLYHLFYLIGIFYLIRELIDLLHPIQYANKMKIVHTLANNKNENKNENKSYLYLSPNEKSAIWYGIISIIFLIWMFIGLFTSQWIVFLSFILFSFLIYYPISKLIHAKFGIGKAYITAHIIATTIDVCFILFAMINHYHLHINLNILR